MKLPPGQRRVPGFPRFGAHLHLPPPEVPSDPSIEISGVLARPIVLPLSTLAQLPRVDLTADFHCVGGWSATDLHWQGVSFSEFYRAVIEPALFPGQVVTHLSFCGLDDYRVTVELQDALAADVLLADRLGGAPLTADHGSPLRLVSPAQYGFVNAKHLCRIELTDGPRADNFEGPWLSRIFLAAFQRHPRARVWAEERHRYLPGPLFRPLGRAVVALSGPLSARPASQSRQHRLGPGLTTSSEGDSDLT